MNTNITPTELDNNGNINVSVDDVISILEDMLKECQALPRKHPKRKLLTPKALRKFKKLCKKKHDDPLRRSEIHLAVIQELKRRLGHKNAIDNLRELYEPDWHWLI